MVRSTVAKLVPKTSDQLFSALEDHLYLLQRTLGDLATGDAAHLRQLAAQLRALVCTSSGMPGLLWRLRDEVKIDDGVSIRYPGRIDTENPITKGMLFGGATVRADGSGPSAIPQETWSLHDHIRTHEAAYVDGTSVTHEYLISRLANESGIAHEAHGVSKEIAKLNSVRIGDVQPYFAVLDEDARLVLAIGERIVAAATSQGYRRRRRPSLAAHIPSLQRTRFSSQLEAPALSASLEEGTVLVVLQIPEQAKIERRIEPVYFPPFRQGRLQVNIELTRRRRIRVLTFGLPLPCFGFDFALPALKDDSLALAISWKGVRAKAFAAGIQVAGPIDEP